MTFSHKLFPTNKCKNEAELNERKIALAKWAEHYNLKHLNLSLVGKLSANGGCYDTLNLYCKLDNIHTKPFLLAKLAGSATIRVIGTGVEVYNLFGDLVKRINDNGGWFSTGKN